ncbi:HAMP domain-containing sensor histidine kinase [uncultured Modestobacter sp.]|uniref:HAMP domain-containing sensor histidine kinase n=1 Tax=uncultured Modestobacter sp. TaxID=380048 RepID=UPI00263200CA|nr:HAMP domain-containing sensor histidine kinase [uncultured Modestobacter sp.]
MSSAVLTAADRPAVRRRLLRTARRPGPRTLRGRAALAFGAISLVLSTALALTVWGAVSQYLLLQRERATLAQASANSAQLQRGASAAGLTLPQLLAQLPRQTGSTSLFVDSGEWTTTSLLVGRDDLPRGLRDTVVEGSPARQRITVQGETVLAVGIPLAGLEDAYFEVFPLDELDRTYRVLGTVLALAVLASVPLSLVAGWWSTRPALRPLERISTVAGAIAAGDLGARLDPQGDPSLTPLAASFNQTVAALEARVRSDARFAADVSHELRTPLTAMLGAMSLVEEHVDRLPADGQEGLALLRAEVLGFERLVADLLEISRADAGSTDAALEDVRVADLVRALLARRSLAGRPPVPVEAPDDVDQLVVRADKRRLERVLGNLIDNADTHGQGLRGLVLAADGGTVRISVDDAGAGVPAGDRDRVFERFARGAGSSRVHTPGAGLGLALVTRHLQAMDGSVTVGDSPQGGARFTVELPLGSTR